ncbi:hypothetical protein ACEWPL_015130 [Roseovarius sp. S1116L3]|uniref:hypothetical protein n=1 Tax=Roseovarius roseus TaxID=3342636 RepID=UPI0037286355
MVADAFGAANDAAHWRTMSKDDFAALKEGSQGIASEMFEAAVPVEHSILLAVKEPSFSEFSPISVSDLANQAELEKTAVEVLYETVETGEVKDDASWIQ